VHPEVVALCVWIVDVSAADTQHLVQQAGITHYLCPQLPPIELLASPDDVIDGCERESLVVQVAMQHVRFSSLAIFRRQVHGQRAF